MKCLLFCLSSVDVKLMKGPLIRPGLRRGNMEDANTNKSCFLLFCLTLGVDGGQQQDVCGHLNVLPLNLRLIKLSG